MAPRARTNSHTNRHRLCCCVQAPTCVAWCMTCVRTVAPCMSLRCVLVVGRTMLHFDVEDANERSSLTLGLRSLVCLGGVCGALAAPLPHGVINLFWPPPPRAAPVTVKGKGKGNQSTVWGNHWHGGGGDAGSLQCTEGGGTSGHGGELVCAVLPHTQVTASSLLPPLLLWYLWCVTPVPYHAWCDVSRCHK